MPNPTFAFQVTAKDKYSEVFDRLNRRILGAGSAADRVDKGFGRWNKTSQRIAKPLTQLERVLDHMGKGFGLERFTRTFGLFGRATADVFGGFESGTASIGEAVAGLGSAGDAAAGSLGAVGAAAVAAAGPISVTVGAVVAGATAVATAAHQWDASGAALLRFSKLVGEPVVPLQTLIGSMEQAGLTADEAKSTILGLSRAVASAGFPGENPKALGIMNMVGWTPPAPGEPVDVDLWNARLAALMAKQRSPKVRAEIAQAFGVPDAATSYYSQGPQQIASDRATSAATMRPLTEAELERAARDNAQWALLGQASGGIGRSLGASAANMAQPFLGPATRAAGGLSWLTDKLDIGPADLLMPGLQHGIASLERDILPWARSRLSGLTAGEAARGGANLGATGASGKNGVQVPKDIKVDANEFKQAVAELEGATSKWQRAAILRDFYAKALGLSQNGGAGLASQAMAESGVRANVHERPLTPQLGGIGLFQWTGHRADSHRRADLEAWARAHGLDPMGWAAQLGFSMKELTGNHAWVVDDIRRHQQSASAAANAAFPYVSDNAPQLEKDRRGHVGYANEILHLPSPLPVIVKGAPIPVEVKVDQPPAQTVDVIVRFQNAPQGTVAQAKATPGVKLKIGHSLPTGG